MSQQQIRPDDIIEELGGCGKYQWKLNIILHVLKSIVCFSITSMITMSTTPTWTCADDLTCRNTSLLDPQPNFSENALSTSPESFTQSRTVATTVHSTAKSKAIQPTTCGEKQCFISNSSIPCKSFTFFDDVTSFVSEVRSTSIV